MADHENLNQKDLILKESYAIWLQLFIGTLVSIGSFLAWAESHYVGKELYNVEVMTIKEILHQQDKKLDRIYDKILERKREK